MTCRQMCCRPDKIGDNKPGTLKGRMGQIKSKIRHQKTKQDNITAREEDSVIQQSPFWRMSKQQTTTIKNNNGNTVWQWVVEVKGKVLLPYIFGGTLASSREGSGSTWYGDDSNCKDL
ncbi:hypothetical protein Fcan01_03891 [Folsomia candida]|uniref:Uncharacterized protein n=1 Tax=Folsomia candida TaxID=158441 RepID=A0A226F149_FOLCA|nr:hypothetical protein Fcan01_03891 [Folsomia candida]